eukprot:6212448-Pleurochrysis_carterae.AAC.1
MTETSPPADPVQPPSHFGLDFLRPRLWRHSRPLSFEHAPMTANCYSPSPIRCASDREAIPGQDLGGSPLCCYFCGDEIYQRGPTLHPSRQHAQATCNDCHWLQDAWTSKYSTERHDE